MDALGKLLREGVASGAAQEGGALPAALAARIDAAKTWLACSAASMTALRVPAAASLPYTLSAVPPCRFACDLESPGCATI